MALTAPLAANERRVLPASSSTFSTTSEGSERYEVGEFTAATIIATRSTSAQVRRAAGSQSLEKLKDSLVGWTRDEIDGMASEDGKNAVHMAAWQGCLDNLRHLLDCVGCGINAIAAGKYSYGKTPIFFAATRSRDGVVRFLLERGAHVKIVNNKGQSVLSIASSHLLPDTVQLIEKAEAEQKSLPWVNYRSTHSDSLEYGDLDPRFLDRQLRPLEDVVTVHAVNPTTKHSRRGSFLRRNPHLHDPAACCPATATPRKSKRSETNSESPAEILSKEQSDELHAAWKVLETTNHSDGGASGKALITILRLHSQRRLRQPWIKEIATRLRQVVPDPGGIDVVVAAAGRELSSGGEEDARTRSLLDRLVSHVQQRTAVLAEGTVGVERLVTSSDIGLPTTIDSTKELRRRYRSTLPLSSPVWKDARQHVSDLSMRVFMVPPPQNNESYVLRLSEPPAFVDSLAALGMLRESLASEPLVAFDTEWTTTNQGDGSTTVSTIQLAVDCQRAWIVDLETCNEDELEEPACGSYQTLCRRVVQSLFETKIMLGFALRRDVAKLEEWLGRPLDLNRCLDLQHYFSPSKHSVPGLGSCARQVVVNMTDDTETSVRLPPHLFHLDKTQQCSDWSQRPLTPSQLSYAALDAAILPYLLAEQARINHSKRTSEP